MKNLPTHLKDPAQTKHKRLYDTVNSLISFLEEKFPQSDEPKKVEEPVCGNCKKHHGQSYCDLPYSDEPIEFSGAGGTGKPWVDEPKCKHQFWRDRNPAGCMNCGKTEEELYAELSKSKELPHWESDYAAIWSRYDSMFSFSRNDLRQDILELIRKVAKV